MPEDSLFTFPPPPAPDAAEWAGSPIGVSNTITRTKGRTAVHNKTVDATPGLLDHLMESAEHRLREHPHAVRQHDVVIHGIRVRATTNSPHLYDFWVDNWYSVEEWQRVTGHRPPAEPRVNVYAILGVKDQQEAAYYSRKNNTIIFFNTSYYGQLKSWVLGAVGRILASEYGIHSIHGACVEKGGKGVLYIAPTGTGKSTSSYGLMTYPETRFHSDDWVYVRYTYCTRDGRRVLVLRTRGSDGSVASGYQVYRWIEQHAADGSAQLDALTLDNQEVRLRLADLDLSQKIDAYAYTSEKVFYLRTNLAENFPLSIRQLLASKEENVPDVSPAFRQRYAATLAGMVRDLRHVARGELGQALDSRSDAELSEICARLIAFDNARSMLDIAKVLPRERVYTNPLQPCRLVAVILLKRNPQDPTVLNHALLDTFMEKLLIGETPDKKREVAYNAYRAVDDRAERSFIDSLERRVTASDSLYRLFTEASDVPDSLQEEFSLFRVMYDAARTFDLNTTLQRDPDVKDKREAVGRTLALIARTLEEEPRGIHLTIDNYKEYIGGAAYPHASTS